jgi:hypothetical protein
MPAHVVLTNEELARRQGAAWNEYQRDHVAGITRRQEFTFTGDGKCTDQTKSSHVTTLELVATAFETMANMRREDDEQNLVHLRSTSKRTTDLMKRRNCYL